MSALAIFGLIILAIVVVAIFLYIGLFELVFNILGAILSIVFGGKSGDSGFGGGDSGGGGSSSDW